MTGLNPARLIAALSGITALVGFFTTMLPALTVNAAAYTAVLDRFGGSGTQGADRVELSFSFYDWIAAAQPAVALIPIALALAASAGILQALRGSDRAAQGVVVFVGLAALVAAAFTAIRPAITVQLTGELARHAGMDTGVSAGDSAGSVSVEPTLAVTAIALLVVVGLNAWQLLTERTAHPS